MQKKVYSDYKEKLLNKPASKAHHYYRGGLLYHIFSVTRNVILIANMYPNLDIDMDLVIFGALVHDIGKVNEYNDFLESEDYILKVGNNSALLGHSYEGTHIIENYLKEYDIDEQFKNQVLHMIGSHMREYSEWGVLVLPKMLEVIILNFADSIDAHLEPVHKILKETEIGNVYKINNDSRDYYKSLNPYYNKERYD